MSAAGDRRGRGNCRSRPEFRTPVFPRPAVPAGQCRRRTVRPCRSAPGPTEQNARSPAGPLRRGAVSRTPPGTKRPCRSPSPPGAPHPQCRCNRSPRPFPPQRSAQRRVRHTAPGCVPAGHLWNTPPPSRPQPQAAGTLQACGQHPTGRAADKRQQKMPQAAQKVPFAAKKHTLIQHPAFLHRKHRAGGAWRLSGRTGAAAPGR